MYCPSMALGSQVIQWAASNQPHTRKHGCYGLSDGGRSTSLRACEGALFLIRPQKYPL